MTLTLTLTIAELYAIRAALDAFLHSPEIEYDSRSEAAENVLLEIDKWRNTNEGY